MNKLAVLALLLLGTLASASAQSGVTSKRLNFAYTHGNPDYVDLSSLGGNVFAARIDNPTVKAKNLKSFAANFRGWRLMDEFIVDPEFFWELDPISLKGKIRTVNYEMISKYPSLEKRYRAIRPVGVNYIVCVNLYSTVELAVSTLATHQVCFRAQSYQMFWGVSRSGRAASYPGALLGWKEGISTAAVGTRFTSADNSDVERLKALVSRFSSISPSSTGLLTNTWLDIRWPDDAIDKIYDDFEEYEKKGKDLEKDYKEAKEEPKVAKRAQPLSADDEMAKPFESLPKTAKTFSENGTVGLVTPKGRTVFSSDKHVWAAELDETGRFFEFHLPRGKRYTEKREIFNASGKRLTFEGHTAFTWIEKRPDGAGYVLYVDVGGSENYETTNLLELARFSFSEEEFQQIRSWDQNPSRFKSRTGNKRFYDPARWVFKTAVRITVDSNFRKTGVGPGYIVSQERHGKYGDLVHFWPFEWK